MEWHVNAAAALIIARHPNLSPQQMADRLKSTATKLSAMGNKPHKAQTRLPRE